VGSGRPFPGAGRVASRPGACGRPAAGRTSQDGAPARPASPCRAAPCRAVP
jgi:hypothetical protein